METATLSTRRPTGRLHLALVIGLIAVCQPQVGRAADSPLPGVSFADLDADEVSLVMEVLEAQFDPCGKPRSLLESVKDDGACPIAPKLATFVVAQVQRGLSKRQVLKELLKEQKRMTVKHEFTVQNRPFVGPANAKVTVIEFFDFQCPHCKLVASKVVDLVKGKANVRLVYKQYPLDFHPASKVAAVFAVAAFAQGKWSAVYDLFFANQDKLDDALVAKLTKDAGVDLTKLEASKAAAQALVEADRREGDAASIEGTPTFFVDGRMVSYEDLEGAIDEALKAK